MRVVKCDHCDQEAELTEYGIPPPGWVQIIGMGAMPSPPPDLCSERCAEAWLGARARAKAEVHRS